MSSAPPEPAPRDRLGPALWRAGLRWQRAAGAALRSLELTHVQALLLASARWLETAGHDRPTQRRLAQHAGTDVMMTSQVLRALEARGLLAREPDPRDARARRIAVTPAGAALAERAADVLADVDRALLGDASAAALLERLRQVADGR